MVSNVTTDRTLCDLGAIVSLMSYFIFKKLGLGQLQPTPLSLQLAEGSEKHPLGILEDVPVKVVIFVYLITLLL